MPSLHVGLTYLAEYHVSTQFRYTWPVALVWLMLIWTSTIVLGWHYILDGFGGIFVAIIGIAAAEWIVAGMGFVSPVATAGYLEKPQTVA